MLILLSSETRLKTLEEIAAAFGDKVVEISETDYAIESAVMEDKAEAAQIESTRSPKAT